MIEKIKCYFGYAFGIAALVGIFRVFMYVLESTLK